MKIRPQLNFRKALRYCLPVFAFFIMHLNLSAQQAGTSSGYQTEKYRTLNSDARYSSGTIAQTACESYTWYGVTYTGSGMYLHTTLTPAGCVLTDKLLLEVHQPSASSHSITAAVSYTWSANGLTYTTTGNYTHTLQNSDQCDSVLNLQLTIVPAANVLNLHCLIQGYVSGNQMVPVLANQGRPGNANDCDSIDIDLRQATFPFPTLFNTRAVIDRNGLAYCLFTTLTAGSYYLVVKHRNALETWSTNPLLFGQTPLSYDFTTAATQAYGGNQVLLPNGKYAFFSGDLNHDENIDLLDLNILEYDIVNFESGYQSTDLNGDGNVDLLDSPVLEQNINGFIFSSHP